MIDMHDHFKSESCRYIYNLITPVPVQVRIRFIHIFESCRNTLRNALVLSSEQSLVLVRQWLPYVYISLFLRYYRQSRDRSDQIPLSVY